MTAIRVNKGNFRTISIPIKERETDYSTTPETNTDTTKNLTGYTVKMIVKKSYSDTDANKQFEVTATVSSPATGIAVFSISRDNNNIDVGSYVYEIRCYSGGGATDYQTVVIDEYIVEDVVGLTIT